MFRWNHLRSALKSKVFKIPASLKVLLQKVNEKLGFTKKKKKTEPTKPTKLLTLQISPYLPSKESPQLIPTRVNRILKNFLINFYSFKNSRRKLKLKINGLFITTRNIYCLSQLNATRYLEKFNNAMTKYLAKLKADI